MVLQNVLNEPNLEADMRPGIVLRVVVSILMLASLNAGSTSAFAECVAVKYRDTPVCLGTFVCTETPQSSFVRTVCFDAAKSYMLINLNGTWYHYCAVSPTSIDKLIHASSVGTYYNQNFRSHGQVHGPFDCRDHPVPEYQKQGQNDQSPTLLSPFGRRDVLTGYRRGANRERS